MVVAPPIRRSRSRHLRGRARPGRAAAQERQKRPATALDEVQVRRPARRRAARALVAIVNVSQHRVRQAHPELGQGARVENANSAAVQWQRIRIGLARLARRVGHNPRLDFVQVRVDHLAVVDVLGRDMVADLDRTGRGVSIGKDARQLGQPVRIARQTWVGRRASGGVGLGRCGRGRNEHDRCHAEQDE